MGGGRTGRERVCREGVTAQAADRDARRVVWVREVRVVRVVRAVRAVRSANAAEGRPAAQLPAAPRKQLRLATTLSRKRSVSQAAAPCAG
jgi:hypothetical protein